MRLTSRAVWCCLFSLIGLGLAGYLTFLHLGLMRGEFLGGPACGVGVFNCHAVTSGARGSLLGMPLSLWGMLGYVAVLALSLLGQQSEELAAHTLSLIALLALIFVAIDVALLTVMVTVIRLYCPYCIMTYLVNLLLHSVSMRSLGWAPAGAMRKVSAAVRALMPSRRQPTTILFWGLMIVGALGVVGVHAATTFVSVGTFGSMRKQIREFLTKQPRVALDVAGGPTVGPQHAPLQIIEFSDFLCPACQRASKLNTVILASHRHDVLFTFKHFPLDTSCNEKVSRTVHPGACRVAAAASCANLQGKFWPFHELIFEKGPQYNPMKLEEDAQRVGLDLTRFRTCLDSGEGLDVVKRDIAAAAGIGVMSTPTYVINGVPIPGGINPTMFEDVAAVLRENP